MEIMDALSSKETHEPQFRGVWVPATVWNLLLENSINATELILLMTVDSLVSERRGCYASNAYLATRLGVAVRHVQTMLKHLRGLGLIIQFNANGRRSMETAWSRIATNHPEEGDLADRGGVTYGVTQSITKLSNTSAGDGYIPVTTHRHKNGTKMPFMPLQTKTPLESQYIALAEKLIKAVQKAHGIKTPFKTTSWAQELLRIEKTDKVPPKRIVAALNWLCDHIKDKYTPRVHSAGTFRRKFIAIEEAMKRDTDSSPQVVVSDWSDRVARQLMRDTWPGAAKLHELPTAIEISLNNLYKVQGRLSELIRLGGASQAALENLRDRLVGVKLFVEEWWRNIAQIVHHLDKWGGRFDNFILSTRNERFRSMLRGYLREYTSNEKTIETIMERLNED